MNSIIFRKELREACKNLDYARVKSLLQDHWPLFQRDMFNSMIHVFKIGDVQLVRLFYDMGVPSDLKDPTLGSPLICLAASFGNADMVRETLKRGVSLECSRSEDSPLFSVAVRGDVEIAKLLLEAGFNPRQTYGKRAVNAIRHAMDYGHPEVAKVLANGQPIPMPADDRDELVDVPKEMREILGLAPNYFKKRFGSPEALMLLELLPGVPNAAVRYVKPRLLQKHGVFHTSGLVLAKIAEADDDKPTFLMEAFAILPPKWPVDLAKHEGVWPGRSLLGIGAHYQSHPFLQQGAQVLSDEAATVALRGNTQGRMTGFLLLLEAQLKETQVGLHVHVVRAIPLHASEIAYEKAHGVQALVDALDRQGSKGVFDPERPSAVS